MTRYLVVPGRGVPLPDHWSRSWVRDYPNYQWAPEPPGPPYVAAERVAALHAAISAASEPAVLVAHGLPDRRSLGQPALRPRGALLVTPPHLDPDWTPGPDETVDVLIGHVPRKPLPFRSILVASRNDPHATFEQFEAYARDWGSELVDAGAVGHLDSKTGFGAWPDGQRLVQALTQPGQR